MVRGYRFRGLLHRRMLLVLRVNRLRFVEIVLALARAGAPDAAVTFPKGIRGSGRHG
jgi:hypothetical protein